MSGTVELSGGMGFDTGRAVNVANKDLSALQLVVEKAQVLLYEMSAVAAWTARLRLFGFHTSLQQQSGTTEDACMSGSAPSASKPHTPAVAGS